MCSTSALIGNGASFPRATQSSAENKLACPHRNLKGIQGELMIFRSLSLQIITASLLSFFSTVQLAQTGEAQILRGLPTEEIYDEYFFTSDGEAVSIKGSTLITGTRGALIELKNNADVKVISGTVTITTKGNSLNAIAGANKVFIPAATTMTIQSSGGQQNSAVAQQVPTKTPVFLVGADIQVQPAETEDTISLEAGQALFCPNRSLKIKTPLGMVSAPAQSRFLISVIPGVVRIYNFQSKEMKFAFENKFRRISIAEEFSVFDHRPTQEEVLPNDGIGRKEITLHDLDGRQVTAATTTFSVLSLLTSPQFLKSWKRRSSYDKKLEHGFLKAAAAHSATSSNSESFYQSPTLGGRPDQSAR